MPICMRDGFDTKNNKKETFHDEEEVFFCEVTRQIFRHYEDYFRHVMVINSTVWQCEVTGRENLTFAEAQKSERRARKKMDLFKDSLRPVVMLLIEHAKQSSYKALNAIVWKFMRKRYFLNEEVSASHKSSTYNAYTVVEVVVPGKGGASNSCVYEETDKLQYKLRGKGNAPSEITVPFENLRRQRFELTTENLQMFIKHNVVRVDGLLRPKPESYKKYVTDRKIVFSSIFIGKMPHFTPAKIKKQANINEYLIKSSDPGKAPKPSVEEVLKREKEKAEKAEAKRASLKEEMERVRKERQEKLAEMERQRVEKRIKLMEKIEIECNELLTKSDDLERKDQRPLPTFTPIQTFIPTKLIGNAFMIREFMHSFVGVLSGTEVFRGNLSFMEMTRAFTVREVAGPLSDILIIFLGTIFDLQKEEEEDCTVDYLKGYNIFRLTELSRIMSLASRTHFYAKRHFSTKVNELPIDALTLSEVLRLHLLLSGAKVSDRAERWRVMYRNGYSSSEDPGLHLRQQYPHIIRALKLYTVFHLPFLDIMRILRCLMDQILTYSSTINLIEERMDQMAKSRNDLRTLSVLENRRLAGVQTQRRTFMNEYHQQCMDETVKNDPEKKRQLEEKLNKKIAELLSQSEREHRKHEQQVEKQNAAIFNFLVYLGMDRAYRKYYVLESMPGIFVEHPDVCFDTCLVHPPQNAVPSDLYVNIANLPRNRKDLRAHLLKMYTEEERKTALAAMTAVSAVASGVGSVTPSANGPEIKTEKLTASQENKENQENRLRNTSMNGLHDAKSPSNHFVKTEEKDLVETSDPPPPPSQTQLYMCSGDRTNCIVHYERHPERRRWAYLYEKEDIDALIESLNPLGERESQLREQLTILHGLIVSHAKKCPFDMLSMDGKQLQKFKNMMMMDTHRKYSKANFGFPEGVDVNDVMAATLTDRILQFENDIYTGDLGRLKVKDMQKWRADLIKKAYEPQAKLVWGPVTQKIIAAASASVENEEVEDLSDVDMDNETLNGGVYANKPYKDPGEALGDTMEIDSEDSADDEVSLHNSKTIKDSVKNLASALLQVEQAIERRFIKEPFGAPVKEAKDKELFERKMKMGVDRLKQWEVSLMESTSYSQVFLHLNILHDCILWARSTNKSSCQVCRRGSDPEKMLLCDECNGGTHMFCMKPKMKTVPEGNWYCKKCVTRLGLKNPSEDSKKRATRTRKRAFMLDEEDNRSDVSFSSSTSTSASVSRSNGVRSSGRRTKKRIRSSEIEEILEEENDNDDENEDENEDDDNEEGDNQEEQDDEEENEVEENIEDSDEEVEEEDDDEEPDEDYENKNGDIQEEPDSEEEQEDENVCVICSYDGGDIVCVRCKDAFHLECANLKRPPRTFNCSKCKGIEDKKRKLKPNGKQSVDEDEDEEEDAQMSESLSKRPKRSRHSNANGVSAQESQKSSSQRRSLRRTGEYLPLNSSTLYELLDDVMKHDQAWPFLRPVSQSEVPDYYKIIKNPMDFAKVKSKLNMGDYQLNEEVMSDIQLVFNNCDKYNVKGNEIYKAGCELEKFVVQRCRDLSLPFKPSDMID